MALSRKSVGCPWNRGPLNWKFYVLPRRAVALRDVLPLCGVAADRHSPALKCTALLLMSSEPWWTQIWWNSYSQLCSVHSVWIYLMRLLLHYIIALQFDHQIGNDWRRLRLDLSRGNIPESCVDMRDGVSFLVFLLPRALQRLSDYPPSQMLDGFCLPFLRSHFRPCLSTFRSILAKMSWVVLGIRLRCWPVEVDLYNLYGCPMHIHAIPNDWWTPMSCSMCACWEEIIPVSFTCSVRPVAWMVGWFWIELSCERKLVVCQPYALHVWVGFFLWLQKPVCDGVRRSAAAMERSWEQVTQVMNKSILDVCSNARWRWVTVRIAPNHQAVARNKNPIDRFTN